MNYFPAALGGKIAATRRWSNIMLPLMACSGTVEGGEMIDMDPSIFKERDIGV